MSGGELAIARAGSAAELRAFVTLPFRLYRGDPLWVPPLISERRRFLDPARNPFFAHAEAALWLVRRGGRVVGRISSHVDRRHDATHGERAGMFGFFECEDGDGDAASLLLERARDWCAGRGAELLRGPLSFSMNHECGALVDGWDGPPVFMMPYNPPSYPEHFERFGLAKAVDLVTYRLRRSSIAGDPSRLPPALLAEAEAALAGTGVSIRTGNLASYEEEIARGLAIFREAWRDNWGFVPPSESEARAIATGLRRIVEPRLSCFAEVGGKTVGFAMVVVDANQVLARLGGRLLPFGWLKALWYARRITDLRMLLFGVLEPYRRRGIDAALVLRSLQAALAAGYEALDLSWILESNAPVRHLVERLGAPYGVSVHRRYRIYEAPIGA